MTAIAAADGTQISYTDHGGDGPTVILVHGITEQAILWDPIVERLSADYRCVTLDLRGHGRSASADDYGLEALAGDLISVAATIGDHSEIHLVGHSLGAAVATIAGSALRFASVVNVDQSMNLAPFQEQLLQIEPMLRDPEAFPVVIEQIFAGMAGALVGERWDRVTAARRADQNVVLAIWEMLLTASPEEIDATILAGLAGYADHPTPYLSLFGSDPGESYPEWLRSLVPDAIVEVWPEMGHYPHLVEPDRFVQRLREFWS